VFIAPAAAQTTAKAGEVACADFLAIKDDQMYAVAAVVEGALKDIIVSPAPLDVALLIEVGIDPAAIVMPPPPMPGETSRVMKEACEGKEDVNITDALNAGWDDIPVADPEG
jgi:hypothetical protein